MFWKRKTKFDWGLLLFAVIALVIILTTALLVIELVKKIDQYKITKNTSFVAQVVYDNLFTVEQDYDLSIRNLISYIDREDNFDSIYQEIDNNFFSVRVSDEKRDSHLQALLDIYKLKDGDVTGAKVKEKIVEILSLLLVKNK